MKIDPWSSEKIENYDELIEKFGISEIDEVLDKINKPHRYFKRNIVFGHRDFNKVIKAAKENNRFTAISGFVPSGEPHLGHKMVMDQLIWYQKMGGDVFAAIADMEALSARNISLEKGEDIGKNYLISLIALGLKESNSYFYFQSNEYDLRDLSFELSNNVNIGKLQSIYGFNEESSLGHLYSTTVQSGDILYPQLEKFGGPCPVVVPAGTDQDPHIRLVRDLSKSMRLFKIDKGGEEEFIIRSRRASKEKISLLSNKLSEIGVVEEFEEHLKISGISKNRLIKEIRDFETEKDEYGFISPSSTYHRFMSGLKGGKMSSSVEGSYIGLTENPEEASDKVMRAKTGGKTSLEEQKKEGGEPEKCSVYELLYFHLIEDEEYMQELYSECKEGERLCGKCKKETAEYLKNFLKEHQEKREKAKDKLDKYLR